MSEPPSGTPLCRFDELADPGARGFSFLTGDHLFRGFVVRQGDQVFGWRDRCPHLGLPLTLGDDRYLRQDEETYILCCSHGALFRPEDGLCIAGPCVGETLEAWPVERRDGLVVAA